MNSVLDDSTSDNDGKEKELTDFSTKLLENQQIGFKLAEEIRLLREELLREKQEKRILIVTNKNLQEQLHLAEERMKKLESNEMMSSKKVMTLERSIEDELRQRISITDDYSKVRAERKQLKIELEKEMRKCLDLSNQLKESIRSVDYWKECVKTYEVTLKELSQEKVLLEKRISEQKNSIFNLEDKVFKFSSSHSRFVECCADLLSIRNLNFQNDASLESINTEVFPVILKSIK